MVRVNGIAGLFVSAEMHFWTRMELPVLLRAWFPGRAVAVVGLHPCFISWRAMCNHHGAFWTNLNTAMRAIMAWAHLVASDQSGGPV